MLPAQEEFCLSNTETLATILAAAKANPNKPVLKAQQRSHPTVKDQAEHLTGPKLDDIDVQPAQPSISRIRRDK
jgi:hypothetical protein